MLSILFDWKNFRRASTALRLSCRYIPRALRRNAGTGNGIPKLFDVASSNGRADYVVTNDLAQNDTSVAQQACNWRWKIEQFHREAKQLTGLEGCQCRLARIVRNHIGCAMLVWVRLKQVAYQTDQTIYQVKHSLFSEYLRHQLKSPAIQMKLA